jgi:hypothetical protein
VDFTLAPVEPLALLVRPEPCSPGGEPVIKRPISTEHASKIHTVTAGIEHVQMDSST